MTDKQIFENEIKCITRRNEGVCNGGSDCGKCDLLMDSEEIVKCYNRAINNIDLTNRQKTEIEKLKAENKSIRYCYEQAKSYNDTLAESCEKNCKRFNMTTRAEAIKEFAARLKVKCYEDFQETYEMLSPYVTDDDIDNLVKEMTGGK